MDFQKDLIAEYDRETAKTRKMLEAIPADADFNYKPHPKSMSLGRLAGHLTDMTGDWALTTLTKDKMEFRSRSQVGSYVPASKAALLEKFDKELPTVTRGHCGSSGREMGQALAVYLRWAGVDRLAAPPGFSRNGDEPHGASPRAVGRVSAAAQCEDSGGVWAFGGRNVRKAGNEGAREQGNERTGNRDCSLRWTARFRFPCSSFRCSRSASLISCPFPFRKSIPFLTLRSFLLTGRGEFLRRLGGALADAGVTLLEYRNKTGSKQKCWLTRRFFAAHCLLDR